ncbi:hypothetical protein AVEN_58039-1 [Araneus ventricosus]|uniref:Uncharacterized protein n=1 Tax=Araneus ventricosus TaxID=182803 RepID=A0A4Y2J7U1_ARAVE|nr:hypothetical protein AVEN_58039-1 [Araneus ventricosus]
MQLKRWLAGITIQQLRLAGCHMQTRAGWLESAIQLRSWLGITHTVKDWLAGIYHAVQKDWLAAIQLKHWQICHTVKELAVLPYS